MRSLSGSASPFTMLGPPDAAACEGDACVVAAPVQASTATPAASTTQD